MDIKDNVIHTIVTDPNGAETLISVASSLAKELKTAGLTTAQIRALFGEVRQIQAQWGSESQDAVQTAYRRLILLKPKMAYRARKERGPATKTLIEVLDRGVDEVIKGGKDERQKNFERFVEFFEAILAYHKAYGGN